MVYRETVKAGVVPGIEELSQVLGCLRLPHDSSLKARLIENLGVITETSKGSNLCSLIDGFGEYDPRAFSLLEEAASLGIVPSVSLKESPIVVDVTKLPLYTAEAILKLIVGCIKTPQVYFLTVLKGLKHRLAAGVKLPNISILLPIAKTQIKAPMGDKTVNVAGRVTQGISALLRRLRISYIGNESFGKIRINGVVAKKWLSPKLSSPYSGKPTDYGSSNSRLGKGISDQQRHIPDIEVDCMYNLASDYVRECNINMNVKPDRVVFNALISACGESGAVDRAFDVLSEMRSETHPIDPDHVTVGALIKACSNAGQVDRARQIYGMIKEFKIKGTPEVYTIAVNSCSANGDWEFACSVYNDMTEKGIIPDEMFFSALIDVAGHAEKLDASFEILQEARNKGIDVGIISYSSLMGACSNVILVDILKF
ncbi:hypothetical protein M8C21_026096 [Ambrosia artemisiifolia]|uniref:Pentatricopeptide repeat-containing protein n=1 Tax=Ambrosia artemisiifolia TaxID=4212 RepID=A0AAD5D7K1_AMBAR|nr:hypothetical protein M8C21_026096 [Ambrosia artemisiifolia]